LTVETNNFEMNGILIFVYADNVVHTDLEIEFILNFCFSFLFRLWKMCLFYIWVCMRSQHILLVLKEVRIYILELNTFLVQF